MSITLSEAESRRVVSGYGVPVSPFVTGTSTAEVLAAVETDASVTFPVVAKLCGRAIAHKTERGLVRLRIADTDALAAACDELL
ncbi:MAG: acetate--CoA ligase family protein, partial [Acidimicrobiaceae bacterium]